MIESMTSNGTGSDDQTALYEWIAPYVVIIIIKKKDVVPGHFVISWRFYVC